MNDLTRFKKYGETCAYDATPLKALSQEQKEWCKELIKKYPDTRQKRLVMNAVSKHPSPPVYVHGATMLVLMGSSNPALEVLLIGEKHAMTPPLAPCTGAEPIHKYVYDCVARSSKTIDVYVELPLNGDQKYSEMVMRTTYMGHFFKLMQQKIPKTARLHFADHRRVGQYKDHFAMINSYAAQKAVYYNQPAGWEQSELLAQIKSISTIKDQVLHLMTSGKIQKQLSMIKNRQLADKIKFFFEETLENFTEPWQPYENFTLAELAQKYKPMHPIIKNAYHTMQAMVALVMDMYTIVRIFKTPKTGSVDKTRAAVIYAGENHIKMLVEVYTRLGFETLAISDTQSTGVDRCIKIPETLEWVY
jgi:hypothetical protein